MERFAYLIGFAILGFLLQFIVHAVIEMAIIELLTRDVAIVGSDLSWDMWVMIHHVFAVALALLGVGWGASYGVRTWRRARHITPRGIV